MPGNQNPAALEQDIEGSGRSDTDAPVRRQALSLGFVLLAGIIAGGAILLTVVVTWGNRMRRLAQSPLPPIAERDELWFLKPKKTLDENSPRDKSGPEPTQGETCAD